ncbi:MAG: sortase [Acidimicrobiia bacterium]
MAMTVPPQAGDPRSESAGTRRRKVQILGWALIWSGLFIFGYLGWQLIGTDVINARVQATAQVTLGETLETARQEPPVVEEVEDDAGDSVEFFHEDAPVADTEMAMMTIPTIGLEAVVFEGVESGTLAKGPGHLPGTPVPGQPGNSVISGHRTTHGRPFYDLDRLKPGDRIELETAVGRHVYEVRESFVVEPTDVWVTDDIVGGWLTLTTCNPKFSARERLIVTAELVEGPNLAYVKVLEERMDKLA